MADLPSDSPPAIVLGNTGSALCLTRSLGRHGVRVVVLGSARSSLASASRFCAEFVERRHEDWLAWLEEEGPAGAVLLPPGDPGLELIVRNRSRLEQRGYRLPDTAGDTSLAMLDKERTYDLARGIGTPCPRTWPVSDAREAAAVSAQLPFPCALKPVHSHLFARHFPVKLLVASDERELMRHLERTLDLGLEMLITEVIPGPEPATWTYSTYIDEHGGPLFGLTRNKLRSFPVHFGTNTYVVSRWDPETARAGLHFLRGVGLRGLAHVEFKRDPRDGQLKLIECNHRFVNPDPLLQRAGLDVPVFVYRRALGLDAPPMDGWREGVRLWFPARDRRAACAYRREGQLTWRGWLRSLAHTRIYTPVAAVDDPWPAAVGFFRKLRKRVRVASTGG